MKNLRLLVFALIAFTTVFTACKKDDEKPATTEQKVLGKWNMKRTIYKTYIDNSLWDTTEETGKAGDYVEFNSNKTYVSNTADEGLQSGSYEVLNETSMTITMDGEKFTVIVDKLDNKDFNFTATFAETDTDGTNYKVVMNVELTK